MSEDGQGGSRISELFALGEAAYRYRWVPPQDDAERQEDALAKAAFIESIQSVPRKVKASPFVENADFAANLMRVAVTFGDAGDMGEVPLAAGRALSELGEKYPHMVGPAMLYLKRKIKGGQAWGKHAQPQAHIDRDYALEIAGWAFTGTLEWLDSEWLRLVAEAGILPYAFDAVVADNILFDLKKQEPPEPDYFVGLYSAKALETLGTIIFLKPEMDEEVDVYLEKARKQAIRKCHRKIVPVVDAAVELANVEIYQAFERTSFAKHRDVADAIMKSSPDNLIL